MIDINLDHAALIMWPLHGDTAEHFGYQEELDALDFKVPEQAVHAIRKWLLPPALSWSSVGRIQRKEACRYCLTKGLSFGADWLPGIDGDANYNRHSFDLWARESPKFHFLLWHELFDETFVPAELSLYRQRVDIEFRNKPDVPDIWGAPEYKPW